MGISKKRFKEVFGNINYTGGTRRNDDINFSSEKEDEESLLDKAIGLGKGAVASIQQGAGLLGDIGVQATTVLNEIKRTPENIAASITGDEKLKEKLEADRAIDADTAKKFQETIRSQKDITGESFKGTSPADEASQKISQGKGSAENFARVGLEGLNVGATATTFVNPLSGGSITRDIAQNALTGAIGGGAQAGAEGGDILSGAGQGALAGAALSGLGHAAGKAFGKLKGNKAAGVVESVSKKADDTTPAAGGAGAKTNIDIENNRINDLEQEANSSYIDSRAKEYYNIQSNRKMGLNDDGTPMIGTQKELPSGMENETRTTRTPEEVSSELTEVTGGIGKYADATPEVRKTRFNELRSELEVATKNASVKDFVLNDDLKTNSNVSTDAIDSELNDLNSGKVTEDLTQPHPKVDNVSQIVFSEGLPDNVKTSAKQLLDDSGIIDRRLKSLMTKENYDKSHVSMDEAYKKRQAEIADMPAPRQELEQAKLDEKYSQDLDDLEQKYQDDSADVEKLSMIKEHLSVKEKQMLNDVNSKLNSNPELFTIPDEKLVAERRQQLERSKEINVLKENQSTTNGQLVASVENGVKPSESTNPETVKAVLDTDTANTNLVNTGKNPTVLDLIAGTPRKVMEKWGEVGKKISTVLDRGYDAMATSDHIVRSQVVKWHKRAGGAGAMEKIAKALDGDADAYAGLSVDQLPVYDEIKTMFREYADNLKLPETARISEYLPHMTNGQNISKIDAALMQLATGKSTSGKTLTNAEITALNKSLNGISYEMLDMVKRNTQYSIKNGFLEKRTGAKDYSFNLADIIQTYTHAAHETMYLKPAFENIKNVATTDNLSGAQLDYVAKVIQSMHGRSSSEMGDALTASLDSIWKGRDTKFSAVSARLRNTIYNATMGYNVGASVRNLSQGTNTYAKLGEKYYAHGTAKAMQALNRSNGLYDEAVRAGVVHDKFSDFVRSGDTGGIKGANEKAMWSMFTKVEEINRLSAYFGEKQRFIDLHPEIQKAVSDIEIKRTAELSGVEDPTITTLINSKYDSLVASAEKDARTAGRDMSKKTQFEFSPMDTPVAMQGDIAKLVAQFQSYNLAQVKFIKDMVVGDSDAMFVKQANGSYKPSAQGVMNMSRLIGSNLLFQSTIGAGVLGMTSVADLFDEDKNKIDTIKDIALQGIPFGNEIGEGKLPQSPIIKLLFGNDNTAGVSSLFGDVATGDMDKLGSDATSFGKSAAGLLIPGGTQAKKTLEAIDTNIRGSSKNSSGNTRFIQNKDETSVIKSSIFGQYSTEAGKDWIKKGFPTLSDKQNEAVNKQKTEESKQKAYDFYTGLKSASTKGTVTPEIKEIMKTRPNRAQSMVEEHNSSVKKAVEAYIGKYGELSDYEKEYLRDNYYITVKNVDNLSKD